MIEFKLNENKEPKPTITETAFRKAKSFDAVLGYFLENNTGGPLKPCSNTLKKRYSLEPGDGACFILGLLEKYFLENNQAHMQGEHKPDNFPIV